MDFLGGLIAVVIVVGGLYYAIQAWRAYKAKKNAPKY